MKALCALCVILSLTLVSLTLTSALGVVGPPPREWSQPKGAFQAKIQPEESARRRSPIEAEMRLGAVGPPLHEGVQLKGETQLGAAGMQSPGRQLGRPKGPGGFGGYPFPGNRPYGKRPYGKKGEKQEDPPVPPGNGRHRTVD